MNAVRKFPRKPLSPEAAYVKASALCARCEQASGDIYGKLVGWGLSTEDAHKVVQRLMADNFISDQRYARAYCRDKMRFNGWGRIKVAFMLKTKGIDKACIETVLAEVDEAEYAHTLRHLLDTKWREVCHKDALKARASLMRFAASRGFEPHLFNPMIEDVMSHHQDDESPSTLI